MADSQESQREEWEKVQPPQGVTVGQNLQTQVDANKKDDTIFPYYQDQGRLTEYEYFGRLFMGNHFSAFNIRISDQYYNRAHAKLRYVMVNFAGLISKICADMLFGEPLTVKMPEGDQKWIDALWRENKMDVQCYESALSNSYCGDAIFKIMAGKRRPYDTDSTVIIEDITPSIYFPKINGFNVREEPNEKELAWTFKKGDRTYLRKEVHTQGLITNEVWLMEGTKIMGKEPLEILDLPDLADMVPTGINESLIVHIPNWKTGNRYFGISDYYDLDSLFFAINNRMTKNDNILDKHSDPILMVPQGVLDEKGRVKKGQLGVIEIVEGENQKPEYIVWDASLENAFRQIEKLVEFLYLSGEISPDLIGMGKGQSDSGRALKFKLMRTISKIARKKLYYDMTIKEVIYIAQIFAKVHNLKVDGKTLQGNPEKPELKWQDGLPVDEVEQADVETKKIDAGIQSKKDAVMNIDQIDEKAAEEKLAEIEKEKPKVELPKANFGGDGGSATISGATGNTPKPIIGKGQMPNMPMK